VTYATFNFRNRLDSAISTENVCYSLINIRVPRSFISGVCFVLSKYESTAIASEGYSVTYFRWSRSLICALDLTFAQRLGIISHESYSTFDIFFVSGELIMLGEDLFNRLLIELCSVNSELQNEHQSKKKKFLLLRTASCYSELPVYHVRN
jgi:hypothetical protein